MRAVLLRLLAAVVLLLPVGTLAQDNPLADNAVTFDLSGGNRFFSVSSTVHGNRVTFANVPPASRGNTRFDVQITGNGTPWDWLWPSTVRWAEGVAPYVSFVPGHLTKLAFDTSDGGRTWQGRVTQRGDGAASIESFKYFINPSTGSDSNACRSIEAACASFYGLNAKYTLGPGDRICLANGTQLLSHGADKPVIAPTTSGARGAPIVLQGCGPGAPPIVSNASLLQTASWSAAGPTGSATWSTTTALTGPVTGGPNTCFTWVDTVAGTTRGLCKGTRGTSSTVTFTIASPGVVTWPNHGLVQGNGVIFTNSGGSLPKGIAANTLYYVTKPTKDTFQVSATQNGPAIAMSGSQAGTQTATSELGQQQYVFSGGSLFMSLSGARPPAATDRFWIGNGSVTNFTLDGIAHWRFVNIASMYAGIFGILANFTNANVTISVASPGVVTWRGHGLAAGRMISLSTTGALPIGLTPGLTYYVVNPTTDAFQLAAAPGGPAIDTSGAQSGVHNAALPIDDITFEDMEWAYNSADHFNCKNGMCSNIVGRGIYDHDAWPDGGGAGDCFGYEGVTNGYPSSFVWEYSTIARCGKDGLDTNSAIHATVRFNFFDRANAGYFFQGGGNAFAVLGGPRLPATGSLSYYGNVTAGDGTMASHVTAAGYQFIVYGPLPSDAFTVKGYCNLFYAQRITNPNFRAVALWGGNGAGSLWQNNVVFGAQQTGMFVADAPRAGTTGNDYNIVDTAFNYRGLPQPPHDLTSNTSPARAAGHPIDGLTVAAPNRGSQGCAL